MKHLKYLLIKGILMGLALWLIVNSVVALQSNKSSFAQVTPKAEELLRVSKWVNDTY